MGFNDDYYWTGGGFSDWSGNSAGKSSSSGGSSSGGSSGGGGSNNSDPNDWKYGCGCFVAIVVGVLLYFQADVWDWINHKLFYRSDDIEFIEEQHDSTSQWVKDTVCHMFEPDVPVEHAVPTTVSPKETKSKVPYSNHRSRTSQAYYSDDDEYDEDGMYIDEDEDIKDKRQYDDYDEDDDDTWYRGEDDPDMYYEYDYHE